MYRRAPLVALLLCFVAAPARGQQAGTEKPAAADGAGQEGAEGAAPAPSAPLRVVAVGSEPFIIGSPKVPPKGLSMAVWAEVAAALGRPFEIESAETAAEALGRLESGAADIAVGPITITAERAERVDFTQPYFESSLAILAPAERSAFGRIKPFLTTAFLSGLGILLVVLCGVGALMWLAERRTNSEEFPASWRRGLPEGIWMALVTMTTVGYGDRVPKSRAGRIITGGWMLLSLVITSSLVAFVATAVTLSQVKTSAVSSIDELRGQAVAVLPDTTSENFVLENGARPLEIESLEGAVEAVRKGRAAALVFDRPALRYYLRKNSAAGLNLAEATYQPSGYGFALRRGSELRDPINLSILRLREAGRIETLAEKWLGP